MVGKETIKAWLDQINATRKVEERLVEELRDRSSCGDPLRDFVIIFLGDCSSNSPELAWLKAFNDRLVSSVGKILQLTIETESEGLARLEHLGLNPHWMLSGVIVPGGLTVRIDRDQCYCVLPLADRKYKAPCAKPLVFPTEICFGTLQDFNLVVASENSPIRVLNRKILWEKRKEFEIVDGK